MRFLSCSCEPFRTSYCGVFVLVVACAVAVSAAAQTGARKQAHKAGASKLISSTTADARLSALDRIFNQAVAERQIPGAVVLVGHDGKVAFRKAYGYRSLEPRREAMTLDTIFDMASLTKCMATAVAVMQLVQDGKVRLNDPVDRYIPEFGTNGKQRRSRCGSCSRTIPGCPTISISLSHGTGATRRSAWRWIPRRRTRRARSFTTVT